MMTRQSRVKLEHRPEAEAQDGSESDGSRPLSREINGNTLRWLYLLSRLLR